MSILPLPGLTPGVSGLVSGGLKLLGGLFGGRKKQSNTVDYAKLRDKAIEGGFNPLTALRNGGAAGFTQTTLPALSSGEVLADALGSGLDTYYNRQQLNRDIERDALEKAIMREELDQLQKRNSVVRDRDFGYSIPHAVTTTGVGSTNASMASDRSLRTVMGTIDYNPALDDTEKAEQRYGDIASFPIGVSVALSDLKHTALEKGRQIRMRNTRPESRPPALARIWKKQKEGKPLTASEQIILSARRRREADLLNNSRW